MTESMGHYQSRRRLELERGDKPATASQSGAVWNFIKPVVLAPYPAIRIPPRWGK